MDKSVEPADNQESTVQGVQRDTLEQASENDGTDELFDIPSFLQQYMRSCIYYDNI